MVRDSRAEEVSYGKLLVVGVAEGMLEGGTAAGAPCAYGNLLPGCHARC
jgi:hypothetical protein